ncbi:MULTISPECIES: UDP-glucose 4-epimerase GalE [Nocardia]|uniref:UDP-glucose 4-epimerase n=1 Tax=Nocardia nova TaxID=37330 RepID=A0A2S5ZYE3_9NOCA|nr:MULTISPECIES: UDP-glucose 4-epimerase GalE [Nocardia]OBF80324.1 UDP-glucose 4-epimerase GalE [Mycobacterium sp. 852002-51759_SCH5129042]MBF6277354.1 UDP-glucose 4-epimerase GalE [Nocardia nova]OBA50574.1 UDP-glucose 4-epimerase GalE [Nocardia sp. 852002-51101_SCH5132738]OBB41204.1 UDP-glucose 4-epimerase GalE [Nocardia sp. 852002-51244_SCH5132740]PPJ23212.1 UDP-glucose 4-epimerase GalE [Nocardia nova]
MKLLVTGGAGYVGGVCAQVLVQDGHEVVVVDDLSTGNAEGVPAGAKFVDGDIATTGVELIESESFDGVLHFAAQSLVGESVQQPEKYWYGNVVKTLALLEAIRRTQTPRLVFSSTAAVYGEPEQVPILESAPTRPTNPYGASKLAIDHAITSYAVAHGLAATSLRYFNVAGAYGGLGENRVVETHLIPLILQTALGHRDSISVFGTDYPTPDGTAVRDYIHIRDLARAHVLALAQSRPGEHRIFNLGSGTGFSVREVISACERVVGRPIPAVDAPRRAGDPAVLIASSAKAIDELGWQPEHNDLDEIVSDAWDFLTSLGERAHSAR